MADPQWQPWVPLIDVRKEVNAVKSDEPFACNHPKGVVFEMRENGQVQQIWGKGKCNPEGVVDGVSCLEAQVEEERRAVCTFSQQLGRVGFTASTCGGGAH